MTPHPERGRRRPTNHHSGPSGSTLPAIIATSTSTPARSERRLRPPQAKRTTAHARYQGSGVGLVTANAAKPQPRPTVHRVAVGRPMTKATASDEPGHLDDVDGPARFHAQEAGPDRPRPGDPSIGERRSDPPEAAPHAQPAHDEDDDHGDGGRDEGPSIRSRQPLPHAHQASAPTASSALGFTATPRTQSTIAPCRLPGEGQGRPRPPSARA